MSVESASAFKNLAVQDAALQAEVMARYEAGGLTAVCELAAGKGYIFGLADAGAALAAPAEGELSDMELEAVAGGKSRAGGSELSMVQLSSIVSNRLVSQGVAAGILRSTNSAAASISKNIGR